MSKRNEFCCEDMRDNIYENETIHYSKVFDEYLIPLLEDGGASGIEIKFCPWCGSPLPDSKREEWFYELEKLGFEEPIFDESIPDIYKSEAWRMK